ncbi:MAG: molybdopterin dinucleotide binding domain-containing protein, partial [Gammaproteobacteria bacterium]|nr:molybdopterin dinucleotide binding domain-containing protein [Gammaproteobacteria bacterium]
EDAAARGIADGDRVAVYNDLARLHMVARLTTEVRPGLTLCESNFRSGDFPGGGNLNHLAHGDPVAPRGGPAFHDNRVEVIRVVS